MLEKSYAQFKIHLLAPSNDCPESCPLLPLSCKVVGGGEGGEFPLYKQMRCLSCTLQNV